jgi:hypothetical protein
MAPLGIVWLSRQNSHRSRPRIDSLGGLANRAPAVTLREFMPGIGITA